MWGNMDGPRDYHTKWSKSDKDKYHVILLICATWKMQMNLLQNRNRATDIENKQMYGCKRRKDEMDELGIWD